VWAATTALSVVLVDVGAGLWGLAGAWVVAQLAAPVAWWWRLRVRWRGLLPRRLPVPERAELREHLRRGSWVSVAQVAQVLLQGTELVIIGRFLGPAAVVPFVCTAKLASVLANQPQIVMQAASPALSELKVAAPPERLFAVSSALTRAMLLASGAVACVVLAVNETFVQWWVGPAQYAGPVLTLCVLLAMLLRHWNTTAVYTMFCFGHERTISIVTLADAVVTVGTAIALVAVLGPIGAPLGSLAGVCLVSLPRNLRVVAADTGTPLHWLVLFHLPWAWRFAALLAGSAAVSILWHPATPGAMVTAAVGVALIYGLTMLPLVLRPPLAAYVLPRLALLRAGLRAKPLVPVPTKHGDV